MVGLISPRRAGAAVGLEQVSDLGIGDVHPALAVAFADDADDPRGQIDVAVAQGGKLRDADAGGKQQLRCHAGGELVEVIGGRGPIEQGDQLAA